MYEPRDFTSLIGACGLSEELLYDHFALYRGYVSGTNHLLDAFKSRALTGDQHSPEFAELKRRFAFEYDGMRLHELYFENLGGQTSIDPAGALAERLTKEFGSFEHWRDEFTAVASMRGIGWAVVYEDPIEGRLFNQWLNEHETGHLVSCRPLLVLDVFEHAYLHDFGIKRADYIEAFLEHTDWECVQRRMGGSPCNSGS